jgi:membrane protease YdiL (CAAX protease family)
MEDTSLLAAPASSAVPDLHQPIAPWWHTIAVVLLLAAWTGISGTRKHSYAGTPHPIIYISMMLMTWMLFGTAIAGIVDRRAFFFETLRNRALSFAAEAARGLAVYVGFSFSAVAIVMVIVFTTMSHSLHTVTPPGTGQSSAQTESQAGTPLPPPAPTAPEPFSSLKESRFHFDSKTQLAIAPSTPFDLLLWIAVSCTAGFCEEHIFRGYLLKQALALTARTGLSRLFAIALSIVITSLIFGSLHLYEGIGGALLVSVLGTVYAVIALKLGNLRAVIVAHFLQDFCAGLFIFLSHGRLIH